MARLKQVYKITYPNGKIYVGLDLTGAISYFGSPSAKERIAADLAEHHLDLTVRKQILWESETATDAEARALERDWIIRTRANDPAIGYNLVPRFRPASLEVPENSALNRATQHPTPDRGRQKSTQVPTKPPRRRPDLPPGRTAVFYTAY